MCTVIIVITVIVIVIIRLLSLTLRDNGAGNDLEVVYNFVSLTKVRLHQP